MSAAAEPFATIAADHVADGWPVVPVAGKAVIVKWGIYEDRLPTGDELAAFPWRRATGLAVVVGPALWQTHPNLWCLEIEARHRAHAEPWLDLEVPHWRSAGLVAESGGGGLHVYAESAAAVRSTRHAWGEIRGRGNICVLPPSLHPTSGCRYRWLTRVEPIRLEPAIVPGAQERERLVFDEDSGPIPEGARNATLFRLGCRLRYCGLTGAEIAGALAAVNASRCRPPLAGHEIAAIAESAAGYEKGDGCVIVRVPMGRETAASPGAEPESATVSETCPPAPHNVFGDGQAVRFVRVKVGR
jgi:hypothetical protein